MRRYLPWLGLAGFLLSILVAIYASAQAFIHPLNHSSADGYWACFFVVLIGGLAYLFWSRQYRLLIQIVLWATALLIGVVIIFSDNGPVILALVWLTVIAASLGNKILEWCFLPYEGHLIERLLISITLGLGILAVITLGLASAHFIDPLLPSTLTRFTGLLRPIVAYSVLGILTILLVPGFYKQIKPGIIHGIQEIKDFLQSPNIPMISFGLGVAFICFLGPFIWALSPTIRFDSLFYHLAIPTVFIQNHGILQISSAPQQYFSVHYAEMIFTLALMIAGQPLPSLIAFLTGLVACGMTYYLGSRLAGRRVGLFASLIFFSLPIFYDAGTPYNDFFVTLFVTAMLLSLLYWWKSEKFGWIIIAGLFSGFAFSIKYNAAIVIIPAGFFLMIEVVRRHRFSYKTILMLAGFIIPTLVLFIPWGFISWKWIGSPFFPYLNDFFKSSHWSTAQTYSHSSFTSQIVPNFILLPWNLTVNGGRYYQENSGAIASGLLLFALPWFYLRPYYANGTRRISFFLWIFVLIVGIIFLPFSGRVRYLLPIFPILSILAALNLATGWNFISKFKWSPIALHIGVALALVYLFSTRLVLITCGWQIPERFPVAVALGIETPEVYLSRNLNTYDALQYLNAQGDGDSKVAAFGSETRLYTTSQISTVFSLDNLPQIMRESKTPQELAQSLGQSGFEYLLLSQDDMRKLWQTYEFPELNSEFLQQFTRLEFARNNVYVYHLYPNGIPGNMLSNPEPNLITNSSFERINGNHSPDQWIASGKPVVDSSGMRAHTGKTAVSVSVTDIYYETIPMSGNTLYTLGEWIRADTPGQQARLQVIWLDRDNQQLSVSIEVVPAGQDWGFYQMSVTAPRDAKSAQVYISAQGQSKVWVDDVCLAQGQACKP